MGMHPEYRARWVAMGYKSTVGSAEVVPPPPKEYRRVFHLTSAHHGISDISLHHLKVARFSDLNDPFELMAVRSQARYREKSASTKAAVDGKYGLLCFSADWTNPVLWGHYGDKHRGVCLGFNVVRDLAEEVLYENKRVVRDWEEAEQPDLLDAEVRKALFRTKFASWSYEEEWRVVLPLSDAQTVAGLYFWPFGPKLQLAEVILGHVCPLPLSDARALVNKHYDNVTTIASRLADGHFGVVPNEDTVP